MSGTRCVGQILLIFFANFILVLLIKVLLVWKQVCPFVLIHLFYLFKLFIYLFIYLFTHLFAYLFIYLFILIFN